MPKLKIDNSDGNGYSPPGYYRESAPAVIDVNNEESLMKWEKILDMNRKELLQAVQEFGPVVRDIRRGRRARDQAA